jgi:uncharacterized protein (TIGR03435 family)
VSQSYWHRGPVVDITGIQGEYDIDIEVHLRDIPAMAEFQGRMPGEPGPSLFDEVKKHGLELKPGKVQVEVLVIDRAQRIPTPN